MSEPRSWPLPLVTLWPMPQSLAYPPSPVEMYRNPSGPNPIQWPLWLNCGQSILVTIRSLSGSALFGFEAETLYSAT